MNTSNDKPRTVQDIIREIETKSKGSGYIYRGERKHYPKVSSKLFREFDIEDDNFDIELVQKEMLNSAKKHIGQLPQDFIPGKEIYTSSATSIFFPEAYINKKIDFEILTELQHYGGKTNLIDFTTDYFIALFFACNGLFNEDGRIILQKTKNIEDPIDYPQIPRHRIIAQKSVFVRPSKGFIKINDDDIVTIPAYLKQFLLEHLRKFHSISTETIYNDLHGFIRNQDHHESAYLEFYKGFVCQSSAFKATIHEEKQKEYKKAIEHYDKAIKLNPGIDMAYCNRGEALLHFRKWEKARKDLITAKNMGVKIIASFQNDYASVEDFEQKTGIQLPEDIAAMLTSS
ncbi:MAG: FRG domain-containing protein [Candidatus Poribacteria bacterium]|nr:FRG domain-containing protein [Candidatus Poribacteria bacterium]